MAAVDAPPPPTEPAAASARTGVPGGAAENAPAAADPAAATSSGSALSGNGAALVAALAQKYRQEFEQTFEGLRQRALKLQESAPQLINETKAGVEPYKEEFVTTVQAVGEVATPAPVILGTLSWTAILVLATTIASTLSSYIFAPIIAVAVGQLGAAAVALAVIPSYGYWSIKQDLAASVDDSTIRFRLLLLAGIEGLTVGFILQNSYLSGAPLAALIPAIAAVAYPIVAEKFGNNRQMLLGSSVGSAVGVTLVLGLLTGRLTLPYLLLTLLYGAATGVTLQYIYKNVTSDSVPTHIYQLALLTAFITANLATHLIFGMSADAYSQYQNQSRK